MESAVAVGESAVADAAAAFLGNADPAEPSDDFDGVGNDVAVVDSVADVETAAAAVAYAVFVQFVVVLTAVQVCH